MDRTPYREFFSRPTHPHHRRYEALRAVFLDGRSQKEVAEPGPAHTNMLMR